MKSGMRRAMAVIICLVVAFTTPSIASAMSTAKNMKQLAREVAKHGMDRETSFQVEFTGTEKELDKLFENTDYEFFFSTMSIQDDPTTSDDADYLIGTIDYTKDFDFNYENGIIDFKFRYFETLKQTNQVNSLVPGILESLGVDDSMSNYDKVKTIHDYVCKQIKYKEGSDEDYIFSMYGGIVKRSAVCNSYSLCMYKLLVEAGVPCKYICGTAGTGRDANGHAWNIVALGDKWYCLDATWDDEEEYGIRYDYFLKGSKDFDEADPGEKHKPYDPYTRSPFSTTFPIAKTAFKPGLMSDENTKITIGGTDPGESTETKYKLSEIVEGKYPASGKFTVKKNKKKDLQLFITKDGASVVDKVSYKVTAGKNRIKNIKNYGLLEDGGEYFTDLEIKGKKKGAVTIQIILTLTNGQKLKVTFKGKVA